MRKGLEKGKPKMCEMFGSTFSKGGKRWKALLAQLVERKAVNLKVIGSNPIQSEFITIIQNGYK